MRQLVLEKENSEFKPVKLRLKIHLVSYPARAEGLVNRITHHLEPYNCASKGASGSGMVSKLDEQNCKNEFVSHWVPHSFGLVPRLSKTFSKLLYLCEQIFFFAYSLRVFHISVSWWSFTGVWVTASLLKSPELFSVFWPISIIQLFGWSPLVLLFPSPLVLVSILWWLYQWHHLRLAQSSLSCSTVFLKFLSKVEVLILLFTFFRFYPVVNRDSKVYNFASYLF